eukprot:CAMPEP_0182528660 /NCGR_PEP_ID=MMETSP1323-20130603/4656_1 /TAXON_ID=236787 /ORGANISM="Florenciella parvula, Strain RCC1693" /LENGTH=61 /DNA_ID=CAMNT_0024737801 /DNA_START=544 /DNA_END=729 /DNA_ORIENTATION=+
MHDEDLRLDACAEGYVGEHNQEEAGHVSIELVLDLALKAIDLGHVLRLMVASRHVEAGGVH